MFRWEFPMQSAPKRAFFNDRSFALSIILFLCFSVLLSWVGAALTSRQPYTPDIALACTESEAGFSPSLAADLQSQPSVKRAFGRMYQSLPAEYQGKQGNIDLISYEKTQFAWAKADLVEGQLPKDSTPGAFYVLSVFDKSDSLAAGDTIELEGAELTVSGVLKDSPFESNDSPIIICTEQTFQRLTQKSAYQVIDIQLKKGATDEDVSGLRSMLDRNGIDAQFSDRREENQMLNNTYWAFAVSLRFSRFALPSANLQSRSATCRLPPLSMNCDL